MRFTSAAPVLALALAAHARVVDKHLIGRQSNETTEWGATCREFTIPVSVTRTTEEEYSMDNYNLDILFALLGQEILVDGSYELSARYCEPPQGVPPRSTLQLLAHGATFHKGMWDFPYEPETYSYVRYMTRAGYSTLAIDLLGSGNSSHPQGLLEAQTETLVQTVHQVIEQTRSGALLGRTYEKITLVGHSLGGMIGNGLAVKYPEDVDSLVLLGVAWNKELVYPAFMAGLQSAARLQRPEVWGEYDDFYQTQSTPEAREAANFAGDYDPAALAIDFETRDLDTLGIAISFAFHLGPAPEFTKPVFLGIGSNDVFFCGQRCTSEPYDVYDNLPNAADHVIKVWPNTGHAILAHRVAPTVIRDVREFLDRHD
ncbi:Epoxide hydrolase [Paramyrothecium foliicola]|nr:Epoxide hydrolase [Paramyrothecium foliicola]